MNLACHEPNLNPRRRGHVGVRRVQGWAAANRFAAAPRADTKADPPIVDLGSGLAANLQRLEPKIEMREGMFDGRQRMRIDSLAELLLAPRERISFAIKLGRRPQPTPQARRRAALHQDGGCALAPGIVQSATSLRARAGCVFVSARQLSLPTFKCGHTAVIHGTESALRKGARTHGGA